MISVPASRQARTRTRLPSPVHAWSTSATTVASRVVHTPGDSSGVPEARDEGTMTPSAASGDRPSACAPIRVGEGARTDVDVVNVLYVT
jgi:hypothetical protein